MKQTTQQNKGIKAHNFLKQEGLLFPMEARN